jgi:hypothetical protein
MYFVRSGYAAMTLKWLEEIDIETRSPGPNSDSTPDSGSSLVQRASLPSLEVNFDSYVDSMIHLFEEVGKDDKSNIAVAFSQTMKMIKAVKLNTIAGVPTIPLAITATTATMPSIVPDTVSNTIPSAAPTTDQVPPPPYQEVGPFLDVNSQLGFNLPEFDTAMFDVNTLDNFDPMFQTMGFWNLGGWGAQEAENNSGFMNASR